MCWKLFYVFLTLTGGIDRDTDQRIEVCSAVVEEAELQGVDPVIAASVAWIENRFTTTTNKVSGASGPMAAIENKGSKLLTDVSLDRTSSLRIPISFAEGVFQ